MAGIGLDPSPDLRLFSDEEQPVDGIEAQRKGREDELVHPERTCSDESLALVNLQLETAAPLPLRQDEFTGDGTESVGLQRLLGDLLALGVDQLDIQGDPGKHRGGFGQVAFEQDALELQRVTGIEGTPVQIQVALRRLLLLVDGLREIADRDLGAPADVSVLAGDFGLQGIIDPAVAGHLLLHL